MKIFFGQLCLWMLIVGVVTLVHPRLKFGLGYIILWGAVFGILGAGAQLCLTSS